MLIQDLTVVLKGILHLGDIGPCWLTTITTPMNTRYTMLKRANALLMFYGSALLTPDASALWTVTEFVRSLPGPHGVGN
jgi:hypothetical protein